MFYFNVDIGTQKKKMSLESTLSQGCIRSWYFTIIQGGIQTSNHLITSPIFLERELRTVL